MNIEDLPDVSDSSDEDYVPENKPEDIPSEVDSDGDPEDEVLDDDNNSKGKKRKQKNTKKRKRLKKEKPKEENCEQAEPEKKVASEEEKNKGIDDIWADFMKDTGFQSKSGVKQGIKKSPIQGPSEKKTINDSVKDKPTDRKVKVTQIFQFAGEEVQVEKEVAVDSAEARLLNKTKTHSESDSKTTTVEPKRSGLGGIGSVLSQLGKKPKISTLEKTKLDWDRFKKEENLEEELQTYNKGKDGYLEKQDFLQRADLRRFEIEKEVRSVERNKRLN